MTEQSAFPFLDAWLAKAPQTHPLWDTVKASGDPHGSALTILTAFDNIIETLERAKPLRLDTERRDFRQAKSYEELLIVRAELVAGAKLARAGVAFDFGQRGKTPEPDLVLRDVDLAVEVKTRRLDGLRDLRDELEAALAELNAPVIVSVLCDEQPLVIKPTERARVVEWTIERVQRGERGIGERSVQQVWAAKKRLLVAVQIVEVEAPATGPQVVTTTGGTLSGHFEDLEGEVLAVLRDKQKVQQAEAKPTILLVDAGQVGLAWMRSQRTWATRLATQLPSSTPFLAVGVMIPSLDSPDATISIGVRPSISTKDASAVRQLAEDLGLSGT